MSAQRSELRGQRSEAGRVGFFTDTTVCIGCKACQVACDQWNGLPASEPVTRKGMSYDYTGELSATSWRHVRFVEGRPAGRRQAGDRVADGMASDRVDGGMAGDRVADGTASDSEDGAPSWLFMSDVCKHCTHAGCLDACPTGAIVRTELGAVLIQPDICNGCGYCIPACPFGVVDRDRIDGRAAKCTLCHDRLSDGLEPACAKACPTDSIQFGPYEDLLEIAAGRVETLQRRGVEGAYLYGAGDEPGEAIAGGLGAFFLLTAPPESVGLPAHAGSPVQENLLPATAAALAAGVLAAAGVAAAFVLPVRRRR